MKCNAKLRPYYFPVKVSVLALVFRQKISKNLIMMAQVLSLDVSSEKDPHRNATEESLFLRYKKISKKAFKRDTFFFNVQYI